MYNYIDTYDLIVHRTVVPDHPVPAAVVALDRALPLVLLPVLLEVLPEVLEIEDVKEVGVRALMLLEDMIIKKRKEKKIGIEKGKETEIGIEKEIEIRIKRKVVIPSSISLNLKDVPGNYIIHLLYT